jgi:wyosine [tRNA(Phe)-imidazoG37] synthetase (radical SAM superfamily)
VKPPAVLTPFDHDRAAAGLTYIYPVVSRRAGGVSIGVNLNPNNACNWACVYCQVPQLTRGAAPGLDLPLLEWELRGFLDYALNGDFMQTRVPAQARRLNDIAISGNGESTTSKQFEQVVALIGRVMTDLGLVGKIKLILITNGSQMGREFVQRGVSEMARLGGEVWFKMDRATPRGMLAVNRVRLPLATVRENLKTAAKLCPTWIQTCMFAVDGQPPSTQERDAYLDFLTETKANDVGIKGVLLYGLARPSLQPEAARLSAVSQGWLKGLAKDIAALDIDVKVTE